jgi:hypothetical protein
VLAGNLLAQAIPARLEQDTPLLKEPGGMRLGVLSKGTSVVPGRVSDGFTEITLQGWLLTASTRPDAREGFDISARAGESIRAEPNGPVLGRVVTGALLARVRVRGAWTEVRRTGWVGSGALSANRSAVRPSERTLDSARVLLRKGASLQGAPDGSALAILSSPADATIAERNGEWVKVRVEAWVKSSDVEGALAAPPAITAAMLREHPERYVGQRVDWRVQFLAHQKADELRPEMPGGAPYLLVRGPLPETGFVYVLLSRQQATELQGLKALQELALTVTLRAARTRYLATPVVELVRVAGGSGEMRTP